MRRAFLNLSVVLILFFGFAAVKSNAQISCVSGFVTDPNGNPVDGADLDFDDAVTGQRIYTPGDNTDNTGFYIVCLFSGIYHISIAPPPNSNLQGAQFFNVDLTGGVQLEMNVTLDFGVVFSGTVKDALGNPIGEVDLDLDDLATGRRIYSPNDNSDSLTGAFWVVVPQGDYRVRFQPPRGSRWIGHQIDTLSIQSHDSAHVILEQGYLFSGNVRNELGEGLDSISIDLRDGTTGAKKYTANNKTDSTGYYITAVQAGLYELRYEPPHGSRYVGVAIDSFTIAGDTVFDQTLRPGYIFTAVVTDTLGNPIPDADLDFILESTSEKIYTPFDKTDSLGISSFAVLADTYAVRVQPPPGTLFDRTFLDSVIIISDTTLYFQLGEVSRVSLSGNVKDPQGAGLPNIMINLLDPFTGNMILSADNLTDTLGFYTLNVPLGTFDIVYVPPAGSRFVAMKIDGATFMSDTIWYDVYLTGGYVFNGTVLNGEGYPVQDAKFTVSSLASGEQLFTPHNVTDIFGQMQISLMPDSYSVEIIPPAGGGYNPQSIDSFDLSSDTSVVVVLKTGTGPLPEFLFLRQNRPNPFNGSTKIPYVILEDGWIEISIYNSLGQKIRDYREGIVRAGEHAVFWDGTDRYGNGVSSGVYYYQIKSPFGEKNKKMLLLK